MDGGSTHNFIQAWVTHFPLFPPQPLSPFRSWLATMTLFSTIVFAPILHSLSRTTYLCHTCLYWASVEQTSSWASNGSKTWAPHLLTTPPLQCDSPFWAARLTCALMYHSSPFHPQPTKCVVWCKPKEFRLCSNSPRHPTHPKPTHLRLLPLTYLLSCYDQLFQEPAELPPPHLISHHIHLQPNSNPVNIRPYRYPHSQKAELERHMANMLQTGLIQLSQSLFSSPVLLVKKKDGSWRCCVDYHALNVITIKDRILMPTINELLGELGIATCFSKLDHRQGFHQIHMAVEDVPKTTFKTH